MDDFDIEDFDIKNDLKINKYKLDEECLTHASTYNRYAEMATKTKTELTKAKDKLSLITAQRNIAIREEIIKSGSKVTEKMIESYLEADKEVLKAKKEVREIEEVNASFNAMLDSFEHRKSELDNLVKLYCAGYYSVVGKKETSTESTEKDIRKNLNKKAKKGKE